MALLCSYCGCGCGQNGRQLDTKTKEEDMFNYLDWTGTVGDNNKALFGHYVRREEWHTCS